LATAGMKKGGFYDLEKKWLQSGPNQKNESWEKCVKVREPLIGEKSPLQISPPASVDHFYTGRI